MPNLAARLETYLKLDPMDLGPSTMIGYIRDLRALASEAIAQLEAAEARADEWRRRAEDMQPFTSEEPKPKVTKKAAMDAPATPATPATMTDKEKDLRRRFDEYGRHHKRGRGPEFEALAVEALKATENAEGKWSAYKAAKITGWSVNSFSNILYTKFRNHMSYKRS